MTNGTKKLMFSFRAFSCVTTVNHERLMKFKNIPPEHSYLILAFLNIKGQAMLAGYVKPLLDM